MADLAARGPLGQKRPRMESSALTREAKGKPCTLRLGCCRHDTQYTIFAHIRLPGNCGMGLKPDDWFGVFGCDMCHDAIDRRHSKNAELWGYEDILRALWETLRYQFDNGNLIVKGRQ